MFGISMALVHIAQTIAKHNAREAHINSLTPEEQAAIRAADLQRWKEEEAHRRALEIAEAGRPRNFWGK